MSFMIKNTVVGNTPATAKQKKLVELAGKYQRNEQQCSDEQKKQYAAAFLKLEKQIYNAYQAAFDESFLGIDKANVCNDPENGLKLEVERLRLSVYRRVFTMEGEELIKLMDSFSELIQSEAEKTEFKVLWDIEKYFEPVSKGPIPQETWDKIMKDSDRASEENPYIELSIITVLLSLCDVDRERREREEATEEKKKTSVA